MIPNKPSYAQILKTPVKSTNWIKSQDYIPFLLDMLSAITNDFKKHGTGEFMLGLPDDLKLLLPSHGDPNLIIGPLGEFMIQRIESLCEGMEYISTDVARGVVEFEFKYIYDYSKNAKNRRRPVKRGPVNYRLALKKYIQHVGYEEGCNFLDESYRDEFEPEIWDALMSVVGEIYQGV